MKTASAEKVFALYSLVNQLNGEDFDCILTMARAMAGGASDSEAWGALNSTIATQGRHPIPFPVSIRSGDTLAAQT